jgi:hypothetical protein
MPQRGDGLGAGYAPQPQRHQLRESGMTQPAIAAGCRSPAASRRRNRSIGMADLAQWLNSLPLSLAMRRIAWLFPLLQTVHILSIGMMLSSVIMVSLRLWGVSRAQAIAALGHRYMPWIWTSLVVVTVTGIALIVGNPRSLRDPALQVKLWLMLPAIATTLVLAVALRGEALWQKKPGVRGMMSLAAAATLVLWLGVTFAGRGRWMLNFIG